MKLGWAEDRDGMIELAVSGREYARLLRRVSKSDLNFPPRTFNGMGQMQRIQHVLAFACGSPDWETRRLAHSMYDATRRMASPPLRILVTTGALWFKRERALRFDA